MTVLAALFHGPDDVDRTDLRLKVSREEKTLALFLVKHRRTLRKSDEEPDDLRPFTDFIIDVSLQEQADDYLCLRTKPILRLHPHFLVNFRPIFMCG